jgi:hypothetical protein
MFTADSQTVSETYKSGNVPPFERRYRLANGNEGESVISDPLLDTDAAAEERARSEFLRNGHRLREASFSTYRTDLALNGIIRVRGLPYIVKSIAASGDKVKVVSTVKAVRYE